MTTKAAEYLGLFFTELRRFDNDFILSDEAAAMLLRDALDLLEPLDDDEQVAAMLSEGSRSMAAAFTSMIDESMLACDNGENPS